MPKHGFKLVLCLGLTGMALFAGHAHALTAQECGALPDNQFLAAVERGTCRIDIQTAAGPDAVIVENEGGDDGHNGRNEGGGRRGGGGESGGGGDPGGGGSPGRAAKP